ncbi:MAG: hypothetical protein AABX33_06820 [Nanoarchaeota archaeon]|mgnify:CR=1 FL=1
MPVHIIVAWINFIIGIIIVSLILASILRLREIKHMFYISISFALVAVIFIIHGAIEVWGIGDIYYALTALIATLLLGYTVVLLRIKSSIPFEKGRG